MSNRKTHVAVGAIAGGGIAAFRARNEDVETTFLEGVAGILGGMHGARLHDLLEPATTPMHRDFFHSVAFNSGVCVAAKRSFDEKHDQLRAFARTCVAKANAETTSIGDKILCLLAAVGAHIIVGYTNGFVGGAISHLALDASTASCIPLLVRGC